MSPRNLTMPIGNLSCGGGGSLTIERALHKQAGVIRVYVNPTTEMAYIEFDEERVSVEQLTHVIDQLGFTAGRPIRIGRR